jgi:hypothetical protein
VFEDVSVGWQPFKQFDLSFAADSAFNVTPDTTRGTGISGPDPLTPWFNLGDNGGFEQLLLDPNCWNGLNSPNCNSDSVLVCDGISNCCGLNNRLLVDSISVEITPQCFDDDDVEIFSGETSVYKYKYVDEAVFDGIEYTYSIVAYDIGVMPTVTAYIDTFDVDGNNIGFDCRHYSNIICNNGIGILNSIKHCFIHIFILINRSFSRKYFNIIIIETLRSNFN